MTSSGNTKINGQCLCEAVQFIIVGNVFGIYQCHCSECRQITGSTANSSCIIPETNFFWVNGEASVTSYIHHSGYRSDFCAICGSPAPNKIKNKSFFWVPAGALANTNHAKIKAHLCVNSKAHWETSINEGIQYGEAPTLEEITNVIGSNI